MIPPTQKKCWNNFLQICDKKKECGAPTLSKSAGVHPDPLVSKATWSANATARGCDLFAKRSNVQPFNRLSL